ncbi:MAG: nicotinate (nicotinamide) nucleotide adenylyltransferase [Acidobacteria bacterium]|nr:nicotinate (nicotinamide) nucleotide adenylyltransferase [Acidobacteriota bacterium]
MVDHSRIRRGGAIRVTRLGILGGTFDPVHYGHLDAALAAQQALGLDEVRLMPSREPPHKTPFEQAGGDHRLAMVALAVDGYEALQASDFELRAPGPSYTSVTLRRLADEQGHDPSRLFFVLGSDAFADIGQWYDYPALLDRGHFVVVSRPDATGAPLRERMPELAGRMQAGRPPAEGAPAIWLVDAGTRDVSSSEIRRRLVRREPLDHLLPHAVADYIVRHDLYAARDNGTDPA